MKLKKILSVLTSLTIASSIALCTIGCGDETKTENATPVNTYTYNIPQDYCRTYYEVFVRSFADGDGDGIGDLRGLINNLDYLNDGDDSTTTDLGVNGIWLMPINASPSYHGYDVTDYKAVNPDYGTMDDFEELVEECNKRGIWIQMDLVLNHTSKNHPWFQNALSDAAGGLDPEESEWMQRYDIYKVNDPIICKESYPVPGRSALRYGSSFTESMPDLNLRDMETNGLKQEIQSIVDFWLEKGVRSFRLDAVPWACNSSVSYNEDNGVFWGWFNDYCNTKGAEVFGTPDDGVDRYCYNVGEVWGTQPAINDFIGTGMSCFNYTMGGSSGSSFPNAANGFYTGGIAMYTSQLASVQADALAKDEHAILSNFLSNHDNSRSAGYMMNDPVRIKRAAALYMLAPGNPYIYYGEELGAEGIQRVGSSDVDPNVRLPFNWGDSSKGLTQNPPGTNFTGTFKGNQRQGSWADQTNDANSILTYYRRVIQLRNRFPEIGRGVVTPYAVNGSGEIQTQEAVRAANGVASGASFNGVNALNGTVAAYTLTWGNEKILIVHNVGDNEASLKISEFAGYSLVGELKANGGSVSLGGSSLSMSGSTVAILKA